MMWLKNHRRLTNLFLLDHVSIESSQSSHFPRSQFVVLVFGLCFCTRVVVYLRFRFVFSLLGLVACLRCSVCHVPSLLGLSRAFVSSRRVPLFSASAFVLGFCLRYQLLPSFSVRSMGSGPLLVLRPPGGFCTLGTTILLLVHSSYALGFLAVSVSMLLSFATLGFTAALSRCSVSLLLFRNTRSRCCSFATLGLAAALSRRSVSLLLFRDARSRCCPFVSLGLAAPHRRRHSNLSLKLGGCALKLGGCASSPPPLVRGIHSFVIWGATFSS